MTNDDAQLTTDRHQIRKQMNIALVPVLFFLFHER